MANVFDMLSGNESFGQAIASILIPTPDLGDSTEHAEAIEVNSFNCPTCDAHHLGWCTAVPGRKFFNVKFLQRCPLRVSDVAAGTTDLFTYIVVLPPDYKPAHPGTPTPDHIIEKILKWDCVGCAFDIRDGVYGCAEDPGRFQNLSQMQTCPRKEQKQ